MATERRRHFYRDPSARHLYGFCRNLYRRRFNLPSVHVCDENFYIKGANQNPTLLSAGGYKTATAKKGIARFFPPSPRHTKG
ncbi:hypothetical protein GWI33_006206 [Rhynchophorus ferrugineus]|uniref:Uncharacterized protein n=1 Tax=Rhynchophorus ferrugineus TaxID=354439 RepID=A0A834II24_RHYFE|nr:hypothetical protein GWI33_006206 [Rhynchophorus ferrugineus]